MLLPHGDVPLKELRLPESHKQTGKKQMHDGQGAAQSKISSKSSNA